MSLTQTIHAPFAGQNAKQRQDSIRLPRIGRRCWMLACQLLVETVDSQTQAALHLSRHCLQQMSMPSQLSVRIKPVVMSSDSLIARSATASDLEFQDRFCIESVRGIRKIYYNGFKIWLAHILIGLVSRRFTGLGSGIASSLDQYLSPRHQRLLHKLIDRCNRAIVCVVVIILGIGDYGFLFALHLVSGLLTLFNIARV